MTFSGTEKQINCELPRPAREGNRMKPQEWVRGLSDKNLRNELAVLRQKCQNPTYEGGMAGTLLKAVEAETKRRDKRRATKVQLTEEQRAAIKSLVEDSGYTPSEARRIVSAGGL